MLHYVEISLFYRIGILLFKIFIVFWNNIGGKA